MASGWYLFPNNGDAEETYGANVLGLGLAVSRSWGTDRSWGWLDAMAVLGSPCGLNLIAGFRWDSYSIRLGNPNPGVVLFPGFGLLANEAELTTNAYIPLIGTQFCCSSGPCCGLTMRVVGFPWAPGHVRFGETILPIARVQLTSNFSRASFIEVSSEYSRKWAGFGCIGIFARYNHFEGKGSATPQLTLPLPITLNSYEFTVNRTSWALGGKISLDFVLPSLHNFGLYL